MISVAWDFIKTVASHRWSRITLAVIGLLALGWCSHRPETPSPAAQKTSSASSSSSSGSASSKVLLATANLVITCDQCAEASIQFDGHGVPVVVHSKGGRLTVQALISTTQHESASSFLASSSTTSYTDTTYQRRSWTWLGGAGVGYASGFVWKLDLNRHVGEIFGWDLGVGAWAMGPLTSYVPHGGGIQAVASR